MNPRGAERSGEGPGEGLKTKWSSFCSIGCGTTWHAASLVGQLRGSLPETKICKYGVELYQKLEEETGLGTSE